MSLNSTPVILAFSGIDGAGKSTQVTELTSFLESAGLRTKLLSFWDDVAVFSRYREYAGHKVFGGEMGVGTPEKPISRRDKNVTSWPITLMRFLMYAADGVSLRQLVSGIGGTEAKVIVFDRYIYDELVNLPLRWRVTRVFIRALLRIVPRPDLAFLIDGEPCAARARKPEYPIEFLHANREAYRELNQLTEQFVVIAPSSVEHSAVKIREAVLAKISAASIEASTVPVTK